MVRKKSLTARQEAHAIRLAAENAEQSPTLMGSAICEYCSDALTPDSYEYRGWKGWLCRSCRLKAEQFYR